jgi:hypothetical protein
MLASLPAVGESGQTKEPQKPAAPVPSKDSRDSLKIPSAPPKPPPLPPPPKKADSSSVAPHVGPGVGSDTKPGVGESSQVGMPPERSEVSPPDSFRRQPPSNDVPQTGTIIWSGRLEKGEILTFTGAQVSHGSVQGALPGVPVLIDINAKEFAIAEAPGPGNGWSKIAVRSKNRRHTVVSIQWQLLR